MNGPQEHPDVPMQPPTPPAAPPPAPPTQAAQPQPAASDAVPAAGAGRARGLQHKVPFIACALSLMPGVGQIYVGYYKLGFIHNIVFASTIMLLMTPIPGQIYPLVWVSSWPFSSSTTSSKSSKWPLSCSTRAGWPSITTSPSTQGGGDRDAEHESLGTELRRLVRRWPGTGRGRVVLLSNTLWGVSLDWIEEAWPLAPILLGAYLVVKAIQERKSGTPSADTAGDPPTYGSDTDSSPLV